ncbi:MAG: Gfo/Idh/MocA family oxidoreductase [Actinobacteria bacterium]|nr:Gfo/Idh/MocA family oxidoreductase [Actinomycetota bacterium]
MTDVDFRPRFPDARLPIAILGCGRIAQDAHLPAYTANGLEVAGVWGRNPAAMASVRDRFPAVGRVYSSPEELLADPEVAVVDIATPVAARADWIAAAVAAGKHVLAQKPLTLEPDLLEPVLAEAAAKGLRVAVNQNGRWAPPWRVASLLVRDGAIGDVFAVSHLHDKPLPPIAGTPFDDLEHMLVTDYLLHWIDISRTWLAGKVAHTVQASDSRVPGQPDTARNPWSASIAITCTDGARAEMRVTGNVRTATPSCPFWIHGTEGTIRGSVLFNSDRVALDDGTTVTEHPLSGQWFVDGFAGAMGELLCAIAEDREPENSARENLATVRLMLGARDSARQGGAVVDVSGLRL